MNESKFEDTVESSVSALRRLSASVLASLSEEVGGIGWWDGQIDFRRRIVLSEYLIDAVNGAAEAILDAALSAQEHREYLHADDQWLLRQWWAVGQSPQATNEDFLAAISRGPAERRRERRIESASAHALAHSTHALDCLAAAILIVGAIPEGVRRAQWSTVEALAKKAIQGSRNNRLEPVGSEGRALQNALLSTVLAWEDHGPSDWLPWLAATRNTRIHRAARVQWMILHGDRKRPEGLLRPFPRHPDLTDVEVLARAGTAGESGLEALRVFRRSTDVVDGVVGSMDSFVSSIAHALQRSWDARSHNPVLLVQRGAQWQDLEREVTLNFDGYGRPAKQIGDQVHVHPELARRLISAHVTDDLRERGWGDLRP